MAVLTSQSTKSSKGRQYRITLPNEDNDIEDEERVEGQCGFQNTGPKIDRQREVVTFGVF